MASELETTLLLSKKRQSVGMAKGIISCESLGFWDLSAL